MPQSARTIRWWLGVLAGLALALVALIPQFHLWAVRGRNWHGAYAGVWTDETAYCSYINALIDGRPRRCDPYTGRDDRPDAPLPESLFSIQFVPAYILALPARLLGLSATTVFIILAALAAFAATLALFWLLTLITGDDALAAAGTLCVLSFGALVRAQKLVSLLGGQATTYFFMPFLRRYLPAVPFPFFFICCAFVWCALTTKRRRAAQLYALAAGLTLALLIFSYFYLWTAAAAWLACLALLWLGARADERAHSLRIFALIAAPALVALAFYARLLAHRAAIMDDAQALILTRAPDLLRPVELFGLLLICALVWLVRRGRLLRRDPRVLCTVAFALTPLIVFNQQIVTRRSLQPIHYEMFIANYMVLLAGVVAVSLIRATRASATDETDVVAATNVAPSTLVRGRAHTSLFPTRVLVACALLALGWGAFEMCVATRRVARTNYDRDESQLVALRLAEIARTTGETRREPRPVVFADLRTIGKLPDIAPQAVLWTPHLFSFAAVTWPEYKERLYTYLYYSGYTEQQFNALIGDHTYLQFWVFGWGRFVTGLAYNPAPITRTEIEAEQRAYTDFVVNFDRTRAAQPALAYVVVPVEQLNLANIDRWYERDAGERVGNTIIYRVRLRP